MNITMERISAPAAAPLALALNAAQRAFLTLHAEHLVTEWRWHFIGTQFRAQADGISATIWRDDLEHLIRRGLLSLGLGVSVAITEQGKQALQ